MKLMLPANFEVSDNFYFRTPVLYKQSFGVAFALEVATLIDSPLAQVVKLVDTLL
jgi:hypothetical protein